MSKISTTLFGLALTLLTALPSFAGDKYAIDVKGAHYYAGFQISHLGYSIMHGRFDKISGTIDYDAANPTASSVKVVIKAGTVNTNHAKRDAHLKSPDFFNAKDFHGVYGNMDPLEVKRFLPEKKVINLDGYSLGLIHGWGRSDDLEDRILPLFNGVDVIVYGHSHIASNHMRDGVLLFNPGTATGYSSSGNHSIGVLELGDSVRGEIIAL